ncbi:hypothetical protein HYU50_01360 [Candidatus Woesearchaeota archaeon]|nr:hypothetical protein [Candidatus Woesearchaeota archaeon]
MENISNSPNTEDYMLEKKFEIMLDMNNKKIANEISKLSSMISKLNDEIASIKKELGKGIAAKAPVAEEPLEYGAREIPSNSVRPKPNDDLKPRYGDYSPEDVPIGKIFYFGNKKPR